MTSPAEPEQQKYGPYSVTEHDLQQWIKNGWVSNPAAQEIRQHPYNPDTRDQGIKDGIVVSCRWFPKKCNLRQDTSAQQRIADVLDKLEDYVNKNSPWIPGTDERATDSRKLIAEIRSLRKEQP